MSDLPPGCPLELVRCSPPLISTLPKRRKILLDTRWPDWTSLWLPLAFLRRWTNIRLYFWSFKSRKIFGQRKWVADNFWKEDVLNHPVHPHSQDQPQSDRWYLPLKTIHFHTQKQKQPFSGTYQCSVLRRCDPVPKAKETLEDDPVAITKSLYMKVTIATLFSATIQKLLNQVYDFPDDQPDLVVGRRSDCMIALKICFQPRFTSTPTTNQTWSLSYPLLVSPSSSSW